MATSTVSCLPSPSSINNDAPMMYEELQQKKSPSSSPSKSKAAPSSQEQSPSLPWLVQYWSSSLLQNSCGAVDTTVATTVVTTPTKTFDSVHLDELYRINIEKTGTLGSNSIYFDETIAAKATLPKPASPTPTITPCTPFPKSNHRKSKSLSERWNDLRSVVASHDDTNSYDYYEDVMMSVSADDDRHNNTSREYPLSSSSCRKSKQESCRNYRKSSIVVDDDEDDEKDDDDTNDMIQDYDKWNDNQDDDIRAVSSPFHNHRDNDDEEEDRDDEYDDDIRMAPPVSFSPTRSEVTAFRRPTTKGPTKGPGTTRISNNVNKRDSMNSINTHNSYMNLHTCHSFDQFIDTTRYLCASSESEHVKIKGATTGTVSPTAASSSSPMTKKQPGSSLRTPPRHQHTRTQTPEAYTTTTAPLAKTGGAAHPLRKSRTPPSPAKSTGADTYTTISLSHSYVYDFENQVGLENSELELEEEQQEDVRDLSTSSSHVSLSSLIEDDTKNNNGHSLFLDRLAAEQLLTPPPPKSASTIRQGSPFRMKNKNKSVSSHSKEEENNNIFGVGPKQELQSILP